jgi:hypothetical protein
MHSTVVVLILLFPWAILEVMVVGVLGRRSRLQKVAVRSR